VSDYHTALVWQSSCTHRHGTPITPLQRGILAKFAAWYNPAEPGSTMYPSQTYFAWLFEVSRQTVNRAIGDLVDLGYLERIRVGKGANNRYRLLEDALEGDRREKWGDVANHDIRMSHIATSRSNDLRHPIEDEALRRSVKTKEEGVASLAERPRDHLWDMFTQIHGNPASKSERGKYNTVVKKLRDADVTPDEYPTLVAAYCRKYPDLQPAVATIAERIGELRHYRDRGPIRPPDADEVRNQEAMRNALQEGTP